MKKWIALLLVVCIVGGVFAGCKGRISEKEAYQVVLDDLGEAAAAKAEDPHIHTASYDNQPCYNIYVTVDGVSWNYVISKTGEIIFKTIGSEHAH